MSTERNAGLMRRVIDQIWNAGDLDLADVLFASTYVNHAGLIADLVHGPEAIKFSVALFRAAFPDLEITLDNLLSDGDTVMIHWTAWSKPRGARTPGAPNEKLTGTTLCQVTGEQVAESWTSWDADGVLQRLGVLRPEASVNHGGGASGRQPFGGGRHTGQTLKHGGS